jgi:hypothetical protein
MSVDVSQIAVRIDTIPNHLLELLDVRKTAIALALPYELIVNADLKNAPGARDKSNCAKLEAKG